MSNFTSNTYQMKRKALTFLQNVLCHPQLHHMNIQKYGIHRVCIRK